MCEPRAVDRLTLDDVVDIARRGAVVAVTDEVLTRIARGRAIVDGLADSPEPAYGVSTGFGALATVSIPPERRQALQRSLIRSHAAGTGELVPPEVVRAMMTLRLKTLASGLTGVRTEVVRTLVALLNAGVTPAVREYGSLGCSGDLAPLAQVALALMGEGDVHGGHGTRARRPLPLPRRESNLCSTSRRKAWPSSTAPTACWACSRWR